MYFRNHHRTACARHRPPNGLKAEPNQIVKLAVSVSTQHCLDMVHPGPTHVGGNDRAVDRLRSLLGGDQGEVAGLLAQGGVSFDDALLQRWLTAKKNDVETTAEALTEHARWRAEFVPGGRILQVTD